MADTNKTNENHPAEPANAPGFSKGSFDQIGTCAPLKDAPNSPNSKSGEPWGKGGN